MSIFDITLAGALVNTIEAANASDRQNTRRVQGTGPSPTPGMHIREGRLALHVWARAWGGAMGLRSAAASLFLRQHCVNMHADAGRLFARKMTTTSALAPFIGRGHGKRPG